MSFITDIFAARSASRGQERAATAATNAAEASTSEQRRQYDQTRSDNLPWLTAGTDALTRLQALNNGDYSSFTASPDYQFSLNEGARALTARNAALGTQDSGAAQKAALKYSQGLASGNYNDFYNKIAGVAGLGQTANASNQNAGQNMTTALTNINQQQASALGSSYINQGNIWGNLASRVGGRIDNAASMFVGM